MRLSNSLICGHNSLFFSLILLFVGLNLWAFGVPDRWDVVPGYLIFIAPGFVNVLLMVSLRASRMVMAGTVLGYSLLLVFFYVWIHSLRATEGLEWLMYLLSFPGATLTALLLCWTERNAEWRSGRRFWMGAMSALLGAAVGYRCLLSVISAGE